MNLKLRLDPEASNTFSGQLKLSEDRVDILFKEAGASIILNNNAIDALQHVVHKSKNYREVVLGAYYIGEVLGIRKGKQDGLFRSYMLIYYPTFDATIDALAVVILTAGLAINTARLVVSFDWLSLLFAILCLAFLLKVVKKRLTKSC